MAMKNALTTIPTAPPTKEIEEAIKESRSSLFKKKKTPIYKYETAEEYLTTPVLEYIEEVIPSETRYLKGKIIFAGTGVGKTHSTFSEFIPSLMKLRGVKFALFTAPYSEILSHFRFEEIYLQGGCEKWGVGKIHYCKSLKELESKVRESKIHRTFEKSKFVLVRTNGGAYSKNAHGGSEQLKRFLLNEFSQEEMAFFVDEAAWGTVSHADNQPAVNGMPHPKFNASLYNFVDSLTECPWRFFITATPHRELKGIVETVGKLKYVILNELPPTELVYKCIAPIDYKNTDWFELPSESTSKAVEERVVIELIKKTLVRNIQYLYAEGKKMSTAIWGNNGLTGTENLCKEEIAKLAQVACYELGYGKEGDEIIGIMGTPEPRRTGFEGEAYVFTRKGKARETSQEELINSLNDVNDPLSIIIMCNKGKMGANFPNVKNYIVLRCSKRIREDGTAVVETPIQTLGRGSRVNWTEHYEKWCEEAGLGDAGKYRYQTEYWKSLTNREKKEFKDLQTSTWHLPSGNEMWEESLETYTKEYTNTVEDWESLMNEETAMPVIEECETCGRSCNCPTWVSKFRA